MTLIRTPQLLTIANVSPTTANITAGLNTLTLLDISGHVPLSAGEYIEGRVRSGTTNAGCTTGVRPRLELLELLR